MKPIDRDRVFALERDWSLEELRNKIRMGLPLPLLHDAPRVELVFGSNAELRALAEVRACIANRHKFAEDFVRAWRMVTNLDRLAPE